MAPHVPNVASSIAQYAEALGTVLDASRDVVGFGREAAGFFRGLVDLKARARRKRRQAGRLWRVADRATGHGYTRRASNLRGRAAEAWGEAQRLDSIEVAQAIALDRGTV